MEHQILKLLKVNALTLNEIKLKLGLTGPEDKKKIRAAIDSLLSEGKIRYAMKSDKYIITEHTV